VGNNNQVTQVIYQYNLANPGQGVFKRSQGKGNTATVQQASQGAGVQGSNNQVLQESTQVNQSDQRRSRGQHKPDKDDKHNKHEKKGSDD
jgi:hypothetical protein